MAVFAFVSELLPSEEGPKKKKKERKVSAEMSDSFQITEMCKTSATSSETQRLVAENIGPRRSVPAGLESHHPAEDSCCWKEEAGCDEEESER